MPKGYNYHKREDREAFRKRYPSPYTGMIGNKRMHEALATLDAKDDRIERAMEFITRYGSIDGAHHKQWVLDQVVRALTGCPMEQKQATDSEGQSYDYEDQGESAEYKAWLAEYRGEFDPEEEMYEYEWDEGIAP